MNDSPKTADAEPSASELIERVRQQFDEAWRRALGGEPRPQLETFLEDYSDTERSALQPALEEVDRSYLRRLESQGATVDLPAAEPEADPGATLTHLGPAQPQATLDFEVSDEVKRARSKAVPQLPNYEIVGELGRGGMGVVYKARDKRLNRLVALKMVLAGAHASPEELARFLIEAEAVAQLQHPNIVQIFDVGEHEGLPFFSLEFVDAGTLRQKIGGRPQPPRDAAEMVELLALAIGSAHDHGVIHRDLKPANVLLTSDGLPKITDFGLAKRLEGDSSQTKSGTLMGTPQYMAPEQARGQVREIGPLVDVYALGVILYEMLTGRTPFVGESIMETLNQVQTLEPVPPSQLQPRVPADLETICLKCLQKEPHKRYASAEALAKDLHRYLAGEPIEARPIGTAERFWRWCRRNPRVAALLATVFVLLAAIAVTSTVLLVKIAYEKEQTEIERQAAVEAREWAERNERRAKAAQRQAELAEKQAKENARIAVEQGRLAVTTFYTVVTRVQQQLRASPGNQKLRQELLADAFAGIQKVLVGSESSPILNRTRAAAFQHLGDISRELGRTEVALQQYEESRKIIEAMAAEDPKNQITLWNQASIYEKIGDGNLQLLGDGAVAGDYYRKCLAIRQTLAAGPLIAPELKESMVKDTLAGLYLKQGGLALMLGDPAEAWADFQTYLRHRVGTSIEHPRDALAYARTPEAKPGLFTPAFSLRLGEVSFHLDEMDTCRAWYEFALSQAESALAKEPKSDAHRQQLGACLAALGDLALQLDEPRAALERYQKAHELLLGLLANNADSAEMKRTVAMSHYRLGSARLRLKETAEADKHYQECLKLREALLKEDPRSAYRQVGLMLALARCGRRAPAQELAEKLHARAPKDPGILFFVACGHALCSADPAVAEKATQAALDALDQAVAYGYRDAVALRLDPDLEAVRGQPRFQDLLQRLSKP